MNIIFDLGGVVVNWEPEAIVRRFSPDSKTQQIFLNELIRHTDWLELDKGSITSKEAAQRTSVRTGLKIDYIEQFMQTVPQSLLLKTETVELMHEVKAMGHHLYCLSNMNKDSILYLEKQYDFWDVFDGKVISCRINLIKPDIKIFLHILMAYNLKPEETIFIDDSQANIHAAESLGIRSVLFKDANQCRNDLESIIN